MCRLAQPHTARRGQICLPGWAWLACDLAPATLPTAAPPTLQLPSLPTQPQPQQVTRQFVVGFANCMAAAGYLVSQGQLPKPRLLAQMLNIVPGLDKA